MTRGFERARSPCWLRKSQRKLGRCRLRNDYRNNFQRWRVDSEEPAVPLDLEKVNENGVGASWETSPIHLPKVTRGFGSARSPSWLRKSQRNNYLRWYVDSEELAAPVDSEKSTKTEAVATGKSSMKQLPKVSRGFGGARSPCWLRKSQRKQSRCWLGNPHRNTFQRWCLDLEALAAPVDTEKVNKTTSKGDAWIRKSSKPLLT